MKEDMQKMWAAKLQRWTPFLIGALAFAYYALMCVRSYSWVFVSSDSGVWLAAAIKWMVPVTYGGPVYIVLSHLIYFIFPHNLPAAISILLSALPSAITVVLTYLIILKLTSKKSIALVCSLVLAGSAIFLMESTVDLYHALAIMFMVAAFYAYTLDHRYLTTILLALGVGTHILVLPIAIFWLIADGRYKRWAKPVLVFIGVTALCYSLILLLMYLPTPRLLAGGFDLASIRDYFTKTSQAIVGEISIFEAPRRLLLTLKLLLMCFGVALIPLWTAFKKPLIRATPTLLLLSTILFVSWYFITCTDVMTWTYLAFLTPAVAILAGIGLSKLPPLHLKAVFAYSLVVLILAPIFLNANTLTNQMSGPKDYLYQLSILPQNSIVVAEAGALSLGMVYYISSTDSHILPLIYPYLDYSKYFPATDYADYLTQTYYYNLNYSTTLDAIQSALNQHIPIYYANYSGVSGVMERCFDLQGSGGVEQIVGLTGLEPEPVVTMETKK